MIWDMILYSDVVGYHWFEEPCSSKMLVSYHITTQKTTIRIFITVETSNLIVLPQV